MGVVVDTNIFLNAENARQDLESQLVEQETYYIAAITVSELLAGVALAKDAAQRVHRLTWSEAIIDTIPVIVFDLEVARTYAEVYAYQLQHSRRQSLGVHDLQIAATALTHNYTVLTSNVKDFDNIPGLRVQVP